MEGERVQLASSTAHELTLADVRAHCRRLGLAAYKAPQRCWGSQETLPMNASRKVSRPDVRAALQRQFGAASKL